jgi:hypothetical protein
MSPSLNWHVIERIRITGELAARWRGLIRAASASGKECKTQNSRNQRDSKRHRLVVHDTPGY